MNFSSLPSNVNAAGRSFQSELEAGRGPIYADMSWGSDEDQRYMLWAIEHEGLGPGFLHLMERYGLDFRRHKIELWPIEPEHSAAAAGGRSDRKRPAQSADSATASSRRLISSIACGEIGGAFSLRFG